MEQFTAGEVELDNSLKLVQFVQNPSNLKKLITPGTILRGFLRVSFNFVLIYVAYLCSYILRFSWLNFDQVPLRQEDIVHYLNLGRIYSFITALLVVITIRIPSSNKANFIRAVFSGAGVVLTSIALVILMQLLGKPTIFFSRMVFIFLAPVSWLAILTEFAISQVIYNVLKIYNIRHHNLVVFAVSLDDKALLSLQNNSNSLFLIKRLIDIAGALIILLLSAIPIVLIAIAIKLDSKGPVFFKQIRVGRNNRLFNFYKFRSMYLDADIHFEQLKQFNETRGATFKMKNDPRVTRVGRFLRRTSLDELPQLINVLRGQMSLVGPRPGLPREVVLYEEWQHRRLEAMPGLTGLWQVSGRSSLTFEEMTKLDIYYMYRCSYWMDLKILIKTIVTVLTGKGAY